LVDTGLGGVEGASAEDVRVGLGGDTEVMGEVGLGVGPVNTLTIGLKAAPAAMTTIAPMNAAMMVATAW